MKKILFTCTGCNSSYTVSREQAEKLPAGIFECEKCGKKIKLAFCPACETSYAIGFSRQLSRSYPLKCRKCGREFLISFEMSLPKRNNEKVSGEIKRAKTPPQLSHDELRTEEPGHFTKKPSVKEPPKRILTEDYFSLEVLKEYALSIFSLHRIIVSAGGVFTLVVLLMVSSWAENLFQRLEFIRQSRFMLHLLNFFEIFCFAAVIVSVSAIIARQTEAQEGGNTFSIKALARFAASRAIPLLVAVAGIIVAFNTLVVLFSSIPVIGPVLYSLLFLPVYVLSLALVVVSLIAFWFYPPLLAFSEGVRSSIIDFPLFIRRHYATLLLVTPTLSVIISIFAGLLLILHSASLSVMLSVSTAFLDNDFVKIISAAPFSISDALNVRGFFSRMYMMHHFMGELFLAQRLGGILLGSVMTLISVAVYSLILSAIGTVSAWAYRAVVSQNHPDARSIRNFLVILVLVLAVMYLFKKVFL